MPNAIVVGLRDDSASTIAQARKMGLQVRMVTGALCREGWPDRAWMAKIRPWWGHNYHFHVRLSCPGGNPQCHGQSPPPAGDGCGKELDWWFTEDARHPRPSAPRKPLLLGNLPPACAALVTAPAGPALQPRGTVQ